MEVLITGANGFVGQHLVRELAEHEISTATVGGPKNSNQSADSPANTYNLDLTDPAQADKIDFSRIDAVIHLAGLAAVGPSFDNPQLYMDTNVGMQVNLFEAALRQGKHPRFLIVSSGSLYDPAAELPLTEDSPIKPSSPYAESKVAQEHSAANYAQKGFESIIARPFNHIGPGQLAGFIVPDLTQQLVAVEAGKAAQILVGNLDSQRDYTDVRDIVRAYRLLIEKGKPGEVYNICSGTPTSGHAILESLLASSSAKPEIAPNPDLMRPSDNPVIYGSHNKLTADTGWQPEIVLSQTLSDVLTEWRNRS